MDHSPPGSSVHEILQARTLERVAMPSSRGSSQPRDWTLISYISGLSRWLEVKNLPANAGDIRDERSIPGWGKSPGEGEGYLLQYSCVGNPMDRGAWWATVHGVAKSGTRLNNNKICLTNGHPARGYILTPSGSPWNFSWVLLNPGSGCEFLGGQYSFLDQNIYAFIYLIDIFSLHLRFNVRKRNYSSKKPSAESMNNYMILFSLKNADITSLSLAVWSLKGEGSADCLQCEVFGGGVGILQFEENPQEEEWTIMENHGITLKDSLSREMW